MRKQVLNIFVAALVGGGVSLGVVKLYEKDNILTAIQPRQQPVAVTNTTNMNAMGSASIDFTDAASKTTTGVVHIKTYRKVQIQHNYSPFDELFRDYFGNRYQPQQRQPQQAEPQQQRAGSGSGVIISADGYIATNNHVIDGADKIEVVLDDRRRYDAEVIGRDPTTDLALLKINETALSYIAYGNSDNLKIGEWVLAVGNPFDLTSTVTAGIVSAKARNINILRGKTNMAIESFIQTDAAVNPGNSGGALVNLEGKLVGINSAIASPTGAYAGYSFAIPVAIVKKVTNDLLLYGQVQRALLGVSIADVTAELADEKKLATVNGVYIAATIEGGSAAEAGIKEGDVVIAIDNVSVNTSSELQEAVARHQPGDKINVTVMRGNKRKEIKTVLKNKLGNTDIVKRDEESTVEILGSKFQSITNEEKEKFTLNNGVKIVDLGDGKFRNAGMKKDFIILSVDRKQVETPADIVDIMTNKQGGVLIEGIYPTGEKAYYAIGW